MAERARAVIRAIGEELADPEQVRRRLGIAMRVRAEADLGSLMHGFAGTALFLHYAHGVLRADRWRLAAAQHLAMAMETWTRSFDLSLARGLPGLGWTAAHLSRHGTVDLERRLLSSIDEAILSGLERNAVLPSDLLNGLVGSLIYALEREPSATIEKLIDHAITQLCSRSERTTRGRSWPSVAPPTSPLAKAGRARTQHKLGLAHGQAGIISGLAMALARRDRADVRICLSEAVSWLLSWEPQWEEVNENASFPDIVSDDGRIHHAERVAWCYGDASIALALLGAGTASRQPVWSEAGSRIARRLVTRRVRASEWTVCHGAAGVAHVLQRLGTASGVQDLHAAAFRWCQRLVEAAEGGFVCPREGGRVGEQSRLLEPGLLLGHAGIGLVLVAAVSPEQYRWDRVLGII